MGGDRRSHRLTVHAEEILGLIETNPGITPAEIVAHLEEAHGLKVAPSSVWRLLDRHDINLQNKPRTSASGNGLTSCGGSVEGPGIKTPEWCQASLGKTDRTRAMNSRNASM